jgi:hypothetical protein
MDATAISMCMGQPAADRRFQSRTARQHQTGHFGEPSVRSSLPEDRYGRQRFKGLFAESSKRMKTRSFICIMNLPAFAPAVRR